jgi:hypothetical protein
MTNFPSSRFRERCNLHDLGGLRTVDLRAFSTLIMTHHICPSSRFCNPSNNVKQFIQIRFNDSLMRRGFLFPRTSNVSVRPNLPLSLEPPVAIFILTHVIFSSFSHVFGQSEHIVFLLWKIDQGNSQHA